MIISKLISVIKEKKLFATKNSLVKVAEAKKSYYRSVHALLTDNAAEDDSKLKLYAILNAFWKNGGMKRLYESIFEATDMFEREFESNIQQYIQDARTRYLTSNATTEEEIGHIYKSTLPYEDYGIDEFRKRYAALKADLDNRIYAYVMVLTSDDVLGVYGGGYDTGYYKAFKDTLDRLSAIQETVAKNARQYKLDLLCGVTDYNLKLSKDNIDSVTFCTENPEIEVLD